MKGSVFLHFCQHLMLQHLWDRYQPCTLIAHGRFNGVFLISQLMSIVSYTYLLSRYLGWNVFYVFSTFSNWTVYIFTWSWCVTPLHITKFYLLVFCYVIYVYIHEGYWSHTVFDCMVFDCFWPEDGVVFIKPIEKPFFSFIFWKQVLF